MDLAETITARPGLHVVVVAAGDVDDDELRTAVGSGAGTDGSAPTIIAADGAAGRVLAAGLRPDLVVGDGDSLDAESATRLERLGVAVHSFAADKDESDTELSLLAALHQGAARVTLLGALGGPRPEHGIANLLLLADPRFDGLPMVLAAGATTMTRTGTADGPGRLDIAGDAGDWVSLFPLGDAVEGVFTQGLRYPLRGDTLRLGPSRGLSNELLGTEAVVTSRRGRLLVVRTSRSGGR